MSRDDLPGVAEVAMQAGFYTGRRIRRRLAGRPPLGRFRYHDLGAAAYLSRGNAVVAAGPVHLTGFAGWWGWLLVHIAFLTGFRNRAGAVLTWAAAFARDIRRERAFTSGQLEAVREPVAGPARAGQ
jgi:NADH dehydrogenase